MRLVTLLVGSALVLAAAGNGRAEDATCKRINKMLSMGRTAEDILTTSAGTITEEDIERCKSEKTDGGGAAGGAAGGEEKKAE